MSRMAFTAIPHHIFELSTELRPSTFKVYFYILRKTIGWHKQYDKLSLSQLCNMTRLSTNTVKKSITELVDKKFIACSIKGTGKSISEYWITDITPLGYQNLTPRVSKIDTTKDNIKYII